MYSAFDLKGHRYLNTGRNSKSYMECLEAIKSIMTFEYDEDLENLPVKKLLKSIRVRIDKHGRRVNVGADECLPKIITSLHVKDYNQ
jgi:hypothetical protein